MSNSREGGDSQQTLQGWSPAPNAVGGEGGTEGGDDFSKLKFHNLFRSHPWRYFNLKKKQFAAKTFFFPLPAISKIILEASYLKHILKRVPFLNHPVHSEVLNRVSRWDLFHKREIVGSWTQAAVDFANDNLKVRVPDPILFQVFVTVKKGVRRLCSYKDLLSPIPNYLSLMIMRRTVSSAYLGMRASGNLKGIGAEGERRLNTALFAIEGRLRLSHWKEQTGCSRISNRQATAKLIVASAF